jgi:hypothetical protein
LFSRNSSRSPGAKARVSLGRLIDAPRQFAMRPAGPARIASLSACTSAFRRCASTRREPVRPRRHVGHHVAHDRGARLFGRRLQPDRATLGIGGQTLGRAVPAKIDRRRPLPVLALPAHASSSTNPTRSATARKAAPGPIGCNCSGSPTSTIFAPARSASVMNRESCFEPTMPASSITNTSRGPSWSNPRSQPRSQLPGCATAMPDDSSNPSAALPASAAPWTR